MILLFRRAWGVDEDLQEAERLESLIRTRAANYARRRGLKQWDDVCEAVLQKILRDVEGSEEWPAYFFQEPFTSVLERRLVAAGKLQKRKNEDLDYYSRGMQGTGFQTFERTSTSAPERIVIEEGRNE